VTTTAPNPVIALAFKHEAELDGQPIGPVTEIRDQDPTAPQPPRAYDPHRHREPWVTRAAAEARARDLGVPLRDA
jgi:hypothetical protein